MTTSHNSAHTLGKRIYKGKIIEVRQVEVPSRGDVVATKDLVVHPGAVVILPFVSADTIVLIRNRRFAVGETLWELPAGTLEKDEAPDAAAHRELIEETGYQAKEISRLVSFFSSPGFCNEVLHTFVATGLTHVGQHLDDTEEIEPKIVPLTKAVDMVRDGIIKDAKSIVSLLYYHAFKQ